MPGQTFTGEALVDALSSGELDHQPGLRATCSDICTILSALIDIFW